MRLVLVLLLWVVAFASGALAQGFQVRPLSVEGEVPPGTTVEIPIEVTPTTLLAGRTLDVQIVQLAQSPGGAFRAIEYVPGSESPRSAAAWMSAPSEIVLDPPDPTTLTVTMDVPISARGNYAAGILLVARPPEDAEGLRLTVRLLVPIIIGMEGRVVRQDVRMADAALRYRFPEPENPAEEAPDPNAPPETTFVDAIIENNGGTFSRFRGDIWVDAADETGDWRQVRRVEITETRLLPETAISLPLDLGRLLPAGDYRIRGELYVDGRRTVPLNRELVFAGHPSVEDLLTDIALPIEPNVFEYAYQSGATRSGIITIENPAISPIEVEISVNLPESMAGRASATVRDTDLSAVEWIAISPQRFQLRPGQSRNLRLLARFPEEEASQQNYYAEISAEARYLDGQRAGSATGLIEVSRTEGDSRTAMDLSVLQISATENPEEYAFSLRATNVGDVLLRPQIEFLVLDSGGEILSSGSLESDIEAPLLPLAARSFGGGLNIADLPEGELTLLGVAREAGQQVQEFRQSLLVTQERRLEAIASP